MILFLDFDGVCHPEGARVEDRFAKLPMLECWLREQSQVDVVISSSWRVYAELPDLARHFAEDLRRRIVGATPVYGQLEPPPDAQWLACKREFEAVSWMNSNASPDRGWICLDDMPQIFSVGCKHLVLCDSAVGLTRRELRDIEIKLALPASLASRDPP